MSYYLAQNMTEQQIEEHAKAYKNKHAGAVFLKRAMIAKEQQHKEELARLDAKNKAKNATIFRDFLRKEEARGDFMPEDKNAQRRCKDYAKKNGVSLDDLLAQKIAECKEEKARTNLCMEYDFNLTEEESAQMDNSVQDIEIIL